MLADLGFLITAVLLGLFAYTFDNLVKKENRHLRLFGLAYFLVAVSFLMWGLLSLGHATGVLPGSVVVGDGLLLSASTCAVLLLTPKKTRNLVMISGTIIAIVLLYIRAKYYYPAPSLNNGVLFFNTQHPVAILLSAIVVLAWVPACMKVARIVTAKYGLRRYYSLYVSVYALTIITAALFIQAKRRTIVIEAFIGFAVSILLLLISNVLAMNSDAIGVENATD